MCCSVFGPLAAQAISTHTDIIRSRQVEQRAAFSNCVSVCARKRYGECVRVLEIRPCGLTLSLGSLQRLQHSLDMHRISWLDAALVKTSSLSPVENISRVFRLRMSDRLRATNRFSNFEVSFWDIYILSCQYVSASNSNSRQHLANRDKGAFLLFAFQSY